MYLRSTLMVPLNESPSQSKHTNSLPFLNQTYTLPGPASVLQVKVTLSPWLCIAYTGDVNTIPSGETIKLERNKFNLTKFV